MDTQLIDQQGIGFITQYFSKIDCAVNEYRRDIGIDAILEIREEKYKSSGIFLAVQLKSGESFFNNEDDNSYYVYMDYPHIEYWLKCLMPVIFIIYSPENNEAYWVKIEKSSLSQKKKSYKISIPKSNRLTQTRKDDLYEVFYGKLYKDNESFKIVEEELRNLIYQEQIGVTVTGLEIYLNSLLETCLELYFHTDICFELLRIKSRNIGCNGHSFPSFTFFEEYFQIINFHNLITGSFSFERAMMHKFNMLPQFIKPLSLNGQRFVGYLQSVSGIEVRDRILVSIAPGSFDPIIME